LSGTSRPVLKALRQQVSARNGQGPLRLTIGRNTRHETEWEIYTDTRFLGVDVTELRTKLIEERERCRDIRLCSDRIRFWAYSKMRPW
jgi:hypothetical protein